MKLQTAITVFVFILSAMLLTYCKSKTPKRNGHDFAASAEFKKLSREEQIKKCGSCHQAIYDNEMIGPHANSYKNLKAHMDFIMSDSYDYATYKNLIQEGKEACYGCHASKNLYESLFDWGETDYEMKKTLLGKRKKPRPRDEMLWSTGIDCITCHFDGEGVVTGKDFVSTNTRDCPDYCSPFASSFFSSNANCAPCHIGQFKDTEDFNKANRAAFTCATCHEEKDAKGKYTHYTYWAHTPKNKPLPDYLNLFTGIRATHVAEKNAVKIVWKNGLTPHQASHCTELAAFLVVTKDSIDVYRDTIRLNRKIEHVKNMAKKVNVTEFPGAEGLEFAGFNDSIVKMIPLPSSYAGASGFQISVVGIKKEQYWLSDSIHTRYFEKTMTVQ